MEGKKAIKLNKQLLAGLKPGNEDNNILAIKELRQSGSPEYLPFLVVLFRDSKEGKVKNEAFKVLCDLKQNECIPFLIDAISDPDNKNIQKELVEACWQNGLKYTHYLPFFVELAIHADELTAFEALTVIENLDYLPDENIIEEQLDLLSKSLDSDGVSKNKKYFLNAIAEFLKK